MSPKRRSGDRRGAAGRRGKGPQTPPRRARATGSGSSGTGRRHGGGRSGADKARGGAAGDRSRAGRRADSGVGGTQVEGRQAVRELLVAGRRRVHEVTVSTDRSQAPILDDIVALASQLHVPVRELGRAKLAAAARTESHQGVIARATPLEDHPLEELLRPADPPPFLLATDGVSDPGNLGALLRTAECAGVSGVVLPRHRAVHVTPVVTKAAAGAVEHLRFGTVGGMPAALREASAAGTLVLGLDMGGATPLHDLPPVDRPVMVVVGGEGRGLGRLVGQRCDAVVSIPMRGQTESLNVSVAGALLLYEIIRRRTDASAG